MEGTGGSKTLGNGAAAAGAADDLIWAVYPPPLPFSYQEGDPVFVFLKTQKDDGAGVLESNRIEDPCEIAHASGGGTKKLSAGRYLVRFDSDGSRAHVRPERMIPKFPNGRRFPVKRIGWIVPETTHFRELIRSQVTHTDLALEVGCSTGHATEKLAKKAKFAVGVDVSLHIIQKARARFPRVRFEHLNIFDDEDLESLAQLYAEKQNEQREEKEEGEGVKEDSGLVIFLDIGGNRPIPDRLRGLRVLLLRFRPRLVCVKSRDLFRSAVESLGREVATLPCGRFVGQRVESLWQSSLSQSARFRFSRERFSNGSLQWKENLKGGKKGGGKSVTGGVIVGRGGSETGATATTIEERGVRVCESESKGGAAEETETDAEAGGGGESGNGGMRGKEVGESSGWRGSEGGVPDTGECKEEEDKGDHNAKDHRNEKEERVRSSWSLYERDTGDCLQKQFEGQIEYLMKDGDPALLSMLMFNQRDWWSGLFRATG